MNKKLNVIVIAAHPDEADMYAGGIASIYAELGYRVKFLSLTNGDCGHFKENGVPLQKRRYAEAQNAAKCLGICEYAILDIHDGELTTDLAVRKEVIKQIRDWNADVIITFHPDGGGHIDNRNAGKIVRDASGFLTNVPQYMPETKSLDKMPIILLMPDYFMKSTYSPDIAINVDSSIEKKLLSCDAHASQFYEFAPWQIGFLDLVPDTYEKKRELLLEKWDYCLFKTDEMRDTLKKYYGEEKENDIKFAEAFEIADFGRMPTDEEKQILMNLK